MKIRRLISVCLIFAFLVSMIPLMSLVSSAGSATVTNYQHSVISGAYRLATTMTVYNVDGGQSYSTGGAITYYAETYQGADSCTAYLYVDRSVYSSLQATPFYFGGILNNYAGQACRFAAYVAMPGTGNPHGGAETITVTASDGQQISYSLDGAQAVLGQVHGDYGLNGEYGNIGAFTRKVNGALPNVGANVSFRVGTNAFSKGYNNSYYAQYTYCTVTVFSVDKGALRNLYNQAIDTGLNYTSETMSVYNSAKSAASTVLNNNTASQAEINAAATNLQNAINGLVTNYRVINFNSNGGTAVPRIVALPGTPVTAPTPPTRAGYVFTSWSPDLPATMPSSDTTLTAQWAADNYKLTYYVDYADGNGYQQYAQYTVGRDIAVSAIANPAARNNYEFTGWQGIPSVMPKHDVDVYGSYYFDYVTNYQHNVISSVYRLATTLKVGGIHGGNDFSADGGGTSAGTSQALNSSQAYVYVDRSVYSNMVNTPVWFSTLLSSYAGQACRLAMYVTAPDTGSPHNSATSVAVTASNGQSLTYSLNGTQYCLPNGGPDVHTDLLTDKIDYTNLGGTFTRKINGPIPAAGANVTIRLAYNTFSKGYNNNYYGRYGWTNLTIYGVDKGTLRTLCNEALIDGAVYNEASYAEYTAARNNASSVLNNRTADQTAINAAVTRLNNAKSGLTYKSFTVTYSVDGENYDTQTWLWQATVTPLEAPTKTGYTFSGWAGVPATMPFNDVAAAGYFTANTYTVTYKNGGGTGADISDTQTYDTAFTLRGGDIFTKTGYTFTGWLCSNSIAYGAGESLSNLTATQGANIVMTAQWTANTYYYKFASGYEGGAADTSNIGATYDVEFELPDVMFDREMYVFTGWKCSTNGQTYLAHTSVKNVGTEQGQVVTFTAQWNGNAYYVYYDGNGATSGSMEKTTHLIDVSANLRTLGFAKTGYTFKYWTKTVADNAEHWADGAAVTNISTALTPITLYAQWAPNSYTVTYKAGSGTGADIATTQYYDAGFDTLANPYSKTGYLFTGWLCSNGQTYTENYSLINMTSAVGESFTMTAQWTPITYTVTYSPGETSGDPIEQTHTYDEGYNALAADAYAKTGYLLTSWLCSDGHTYAPGAAIKNLSTTQGSVLTIAAQWTPITYTVLYKPGTAAGSDISLAATYDVSMNTKPSTTYSKGTAYSFAGWLCSNGQTFAADVDVINLTAIQGATVTLTAQWTAKETFFVVRYASGLGDGEDIDFNLPLGSTVKLQNAELFSRVGYTVSQWYCDLNGNYYIPGSTPGVLTREADTVVTMTAVWTPNNIKVIYNPNGAEGTMPTSLFKYNTRGNLLANAYTLDGAAFAGWNTEADGTGMAYANKASVFNLSTGADVTLYAQWKYVERKVSFVTNGGEAMNTLTVAVGAQFPAIGTPVYDAAHEFAGWFTDAAFTTPVAYTVMPDSDVTLYAKWNRVTRNITLSVTGNGVVTLYVNDVKTPINGTLTVTYGDVIKLAATPGENSEFAGFTANGSALAANYPLAITENTALTAAFNEKIVQYTVTVVGGTVFKQTSATVNANTLVALVPDDKENFGCWALDAQGNTVISESNSFAFVVTGNVTVWAINAEAEKPSVSMFSAAYAKSGTKYKLTYTGIVSVPDGWTVTGYGLLLVKSPVASFKSNEDNFIYTNTVVESQTISKVAASAMNAAGQYKVSITGVPKSTACAARMYLICKDAGNATYYFYSDVSYLTTP